MTAHLYLWFVEVIEKYKPRERKRRVRPYVVLAKTADEAEQLALGEAGADVWPDKFKIVGAPEPWDGRTVSLGLRLREPSQIAPNSVRRVTFRGKGSD